MKPGISSSSPLRLHEFDEYTFQDLCCDLFDREDVISSAEVYGVRGQRQDGIDLIAHQNSGVEIEVGQCKCYKIFSSKKIKNASDEFFEHWNRWSQEKVKRFILFVACDLSDRKCQDQILKEKNRFAKHQIKYEAWSRKTIKKKLRPYPELVRQYFTTHPDYFVSIICGIAPPSPSFTSDTVQQNPLIVSAAIAQCEKLLTRLSTDVEKQLEEMRTAWREGRRHQAIKWVDEQRRDNTVWLSLAKNVRAKILRFEASLVLDKTGDLKLSRSLADEAHWLSPADDQSIIRILIALRDSGAKKTLEMLKDAKDLDHLNLKAGLFLEIGSIDECQSTLEYVKTRLQPDAETFRVMALSHLLSKDLSEARLAIQKAFEISPRWKSVRMAVGMIGYLSVLSPAILPSGLISWPQPIDWSFVKCDDESLSRLNESGEIFLQLTKETDNNEERQQLETWRLACLANNPFCQEEAVHYCQEIHKKNRTHFQAIIWSIARNLGLKLGTSENHLDKLVCKGRAEIPHILTLASIYLSSGVQKVKKAIKILEDSKALFEKKGANDLWVFWFSQSLLARGDSTNAIKAIENSALTIDLRHAKSLVLKEITRKTGEWEPLLEHLEICYQETDDPIFLFESCKMMAFHKQWPYVADHAERLIQELQTADSVRLAAIGAINANRPNLCLRLLDQNRGLFRGHGLPNELRRIRTYCCQRIGALPEAISEAETIVNEDPTLQHLIDLIHIYSSVGDLKSLVRVARQLLEYPDLDSENALRIASFVRFEDHELSLALWKHAKSHGISDELAVHAINLGYQLGLDAELGPLLSRMLQLGREGRGGIKKATMDDLISFSKQRHERSEWINEIYQKGEAPIHLITTQLNRSLVEFYHSLLDRNEATSRPVHQFPLLIRHGGHQLMPSFPESMPGIRICMDVTAVLLSMHLGILSEVEKSFRSIAIPPDLIPALLHMMDMLSHPQPRQLEAHKKIFDLVQKGRAHILEDLLPLGCENASLISELGENRAVLYEHARSKEGYLVDRFPLKKRDLSDQEATLEKEVYDNFTSCRFIVDSLRNEGPLSESEYSDALHTLRTQGNDQPGGIVPIQGRLLVFHRGILEFFASANMLDIICDRFKIAIEKRDFEELKAALGEYDQKAADAGWLSTLIDMLRKGISNGTYVVLPEQPDGKNGLKEFSLDPPTTKCLVTLLNFNAEGNEVIWSDDRYVNKYISRDTIPIIGVSEVLKALVAKGSLRIEDYYDKVLTLRAANTRFIPIDKDEILYHLNQAAVQGSCVTETRALSIIRRYVASCLYQGYILQHPPLPKGAPNEQGEIAFILSLMRAISASILEIWENYSENENICRARADYLVDSFYFNLFGVSNVLSMERSLQEGKYITSIGLAGLLSQAIGLSPSSKTDEFLHRRKYFEWLHDRILKKCIAANPELVLGIADSLKKMLQSTIDNVSKKVKLPRLEQWLYQAYYEDLPQVIKNELSRDITFMDSIGIRTALAFEIDGLTFRADDFWEAAAEAVNGRTARIYTIDSKLLIVLQPAENAITKGSFCMKLPDISDKKRVKDDLFELLSESPNRREAALRRNRHWFDCSKKDFEKAIGEIATTEHIRERIEKTLSWRNSSATVYYSGIRSKAATQQTFQLTDTFPPSADGFLRHFRLCNCEYTSATFNKSLEQASAMLISEEGLFETINRLSGLPVQLSTTLLDSILALPLPESRVLIRKLCRSMISPVSKIHFIRILAQLSGKIPAYKQLAESVAENLLSSIGKEEFEGFHSLLNWVKMEFEYWQEAQEWAVPVKLSMIWAHANKLFTIIRSAGAPASSIFEVFKRASSKMPPDMFERNCDFEFDVTHPYRLMWEGFLFAGLSYGLGHKLSLIIDKRIQNLVSAIITDELDGEPIPKLPLLRDTTLSRNNLKSFLSLDLGKALYSLLKNEDCRKYQSQSLASQLEQALDRISLSSSKPSDWRLVQAIIGDLPPTKNLTNPIKRAIRKTDFVSLYKEDPLFGAMAFSTATSQIINLNDEKLRCHLRDQLIQISKMLAQMHKNLAKHSRENETDIAKTLKVFLLDSARHLALATQQRDSVSSEFAGISSDIIEAWNECIKVYRPIIQRMCDELPIDYAKDIWPLLLRLRAEQ